ncbi:hypothetical protein ACLOJK_001691 [Asimina triloba]
MKRTREDSSDAETDLRTANFLMLLARGDADGAEATTDQAQPSARVFECKTCNRQFPSFQALGGHRASHKKPRLADDGNGPAQNNPQKPRVHGCSICGLEFAIGQALGGHMRRHRSSVEGFSESQPVVKKSNSRRVFSVDLNLTPDENESAFSLGGGGGLREKISLSGGLGGKISVVH